VLAVANATLTDTVVVPLLQRLIPNTVKVVAGTVYSVVFVAAAKAACPNNPVAIVESPSIVQ
jgi:hypothetical protein